MTEQLLLHYTRLVEFLGHVLGPDYEIILHEILPEQSRVAAIANGGGEPHPPEDMGFMYQRAFSDPDGHGWGPFWMNPDGIPPQE